jgi:hypothetical protein
LGDDEIDYNLYDVTHPNGSNFYGEAIENMNLLEAVPDQNLSLRFKLTDVSNGSGGSTTAYVMSLTPATTTLDDNRTSVSITPTISGYDGDYSYYIEGTAGTNIGQYLRFEINSTSGVLQINRLAAPSAQRQYQITIAEEGSSTNANVVITLLPSGVTP